MELGTEAVRFVAEVSLVALLSASFDVTNLLILGRVNLIRLFLKI